MAANNKCRKFEANIFNKTKCQNCFKSKEEHSAKALENSRNARKVAKCGYLFVAPESFDFNNPLDRTRRWQRRFFVLYDDGELTYSVDENVGTIPQGIIDMNHCTDVHNAESETSHQLSIAVVTPKSVTYIKGGTKEEIGRWCDVLSVYPGTTKGKSKKILQKSLTQLAPPGHDADVRRQDVLSSVENVQAQMSSSAQRASPAQAHGANGSCTVASGTAKNEAGSATESFTDDDVSVRQGSTSSGSTSVVLVDRPLPTYRGMRSLKHKNDRSTFRHGTGLADLYKATSLQELTDGSASKSGNGESAQLTPATVDAVVSTDLSSQNHGEGISDSGYFKKGWLLKQSENQEWVKYWFVLTSSGLNHYQDSHDELTNNIESTFLLSPAAEVTEQDTAHTYAFCVSSNGVELVLAATTSGMRRAWIEAFVSCIGQLSTNAESEPVVSKDTTDNVSLSRRSRLPVPSDAITSPHSGTVVTSSIGGVTDSRRTRQPASSESDSALSKLHFMSDVTTLSETAHKQTVDLSESADVHWKDLEDSSNESSIATDVAGDNTLVELLENEVASLKRQLEFSQNQVADLRRINSDIKDHLERGIPLERLHSEALRPIAQEKLKQVEAIAERSQLKTKSLKRKLTQAFKTMKAQKKEIESLQEQLAECPSKVRATVELENSKAIRDIKDERDQLLQQMATMEKNNVEMERQLESKISSHRDEISVLKRGLKQTEEVCRTMNEQLELKYSEVNRLKAEIDQKTSEMNTAKQVYDTEISKLKVTVARIPALESAANRCDRLEEDKRKLVAELSSCRAQLDDMLASHAVERSKQQAILSDNEQLIAKLQRELNEAKMFKADSDSEKNKLAVSDRQKKQLEAELQRSEQRCAELTSKVDGLKRELRLQEVNHEENVKKLEAHIADLSSKVTSTERRNRRLEQERSLTDTQSTADENAGTGILSSRGSPADNSTAGPNESQRSSEAVSDEVYRLRARVRDLETELEKAKRSVDSPDGKTGARRVQRSLTLDARTDEAADRRIALLEARVRDMQAEYEQELDLLRAAHKRELARGKDEMLQLLATAETSSIPVDEELVRRKYMKEIERIKEMYDRSYSTLEKSHQRAIMEMKLTHKQEMDRMCQEKDELLRMEAQDTQAALEAMRKAHEVELAKERSRMRELITEMNMNADRESQRSQHSDELALIRADIQQLTEQYSVKCLECAALAERLEAQTKALHDSRRRIHDLLARNDELNTRLKFDVDRLARQLDRRISQADFDGGDDDDQQVQQLKMALDIKQTELMQLQEQLAMVEHQLHISQEELKEFRDKYHELQAAQHSLLMSSTDQLYITESESDDTEPGGTPTQPGGSGRSSRAISNQYPWHSPATSSFSSPEASAAASISSSSQQPSASSRFESRQYEI